MKNIPIFTASAGTASLVLKEIPKWGKAYVIVRSVWTSAEALLSECLEFCRAAGAEKVYASYGQEELPVSLAYTLLEMELPKEKLPQPREALDLEPLTEENGPDYIAVYNRCFRQVPGAASYTMEDVHRLLGQDAAFLCRRGGEWAGVAEISPQGLEGVGVLPEHRGLGWDLVTSVLQKVEGETLSLKVADTNSRAWALYDRLGFRETRVVSRWYLLGEQEVEA